MVKKFPAIMNLSTFPWYKNFLSANILSQAVKLLTYIWEIPISNMFRDNSLGWKCSWFSSVPSA